MKKVSEIPFVSIIIPVLNEAESLRKCLSSVARQTYPHASYEIIVVDNGSSKTIPQVAAEFDRVIYLKETGGFSYNARNKGIHIARGDFLAFTDADCIPEADWLENGVRRFQEEKNCGIIGGKIKLFFQRENKPNAIELFESLFYLQQEHFIEKMHFSATANLFTCKSVFEQVGIFDSDFTSSGDLEFGNRVYENGLRIVFEQKAIVNHPARNNLSSFLKRERRIRGGAIYLHRQNKSWVNPYELGIISGAVPPLKRMLLFFSNPEIQGFSDKIQMTAILILAHYVKWLETLRLALGGKPLR